MDATPKGPPVPPTPDILSPLFSRRISDLNVRAPFSALHQRPQRSRRISRHPTLDARRTTETTAHVASSLSYTCLNFSRLFRRKLKQLPILYLHVLDSNNNHQPVRSRKSNIRILGVASALTSRNHTRFRCPLARTTVGSETTAPRTGENATTPAITISQSPNEGSRRSFFTPVFTPRRSCRRFDAFFTRPAAKRLQAVEVLLTGVASRAKHIYRLRPKAPNSELQPNRSRKQCRAALPRVLCKKRRGEFAPIIASSTHSLIMRTTTSRRPSIRF